MGNVPPEGQERRTFVKACMAAIGGLISLAMGVPTDRICDLTRPPKSIQKVGRSRNR